MLFIAYVTIAGIALVEAVTLPFGPSVVLTLAFIALFALLLLLRKARRLPRAWVVADAAAQTALAVGVMLLGDSWMLGGRPVLYHLRQPRLRAAHALRLRMERHRLPLGARLLPDRRAAIRMGSPALLPGHIRPDRPLRPAPPRPRSEGESLRLLDELGEAQGKLSELAVLEERQRLAREIHDAVGYRLTASAMLLESAARLVPADPDRAVRLIETSRDQVREGLAELRTAVRTLREDEADKLPLEGILGALVDVFSQSVEAKVSLRIREGLPEPDTDRKLVLVRTRRKP